MNLLLAVFPPLTFAASSLANSEASSHEASVSIQSDSLVPSPMIGTILVLSSAVIYSLGQYLRLKTQPGQKIFGTPRNPDGSEWTPEDQFEWIKNQIKNPTACDNPIAYIENLCLNRVKKISKSTESTIDKVKQLEGLIKNGSIQAYKQELTWRSRERCFILNTEQGNQYKFSDCCIVRRTSVMLISPPEATAGSPAVPAET